MSDDPDILVLLTSTRTEFEAQTIAESLNTHGIPARAFGAAAAIGQWELGIRNDFQVMVRRRDLQRAGSILRAVQAESVDIDWEEVDVGESSDTAGSRTGKGPFADASSPAKSAWARRTGLAFFVLAMTVVYLPLALPAAIIALMCELWLTLNRRDGRV